MKLYVSPRVRGADTVSGYEDKGARRARRIAAFSPDYRRSINELTACSPALEDLADAFPGLLFALATGYGQAPARMQAVEMILLGTPLKGVADTLGVPWWLRKLPAYAFQSPLVALPRDNDYTVRMASLVPADAGPAPQWLRLVSQAYLSGGRQFSLWIGRHGVALAGAMNDHRLVMMMAWAWAASAPGTLAHGLLRAPWTSEMGIKRVLEEFTAWTQRVALVEWLGNGALTPWVPDGVHNGFTFTTLRTAGDFITVAEALDNCLEQYADRLRAEACAVASIAKGNRVVACVEIAPHANDPAMPTVVQLRGMKNRRVGIDIWQATYSWLAVPPPKGVTSDRLVPPLADRNVARSNLWEPYLQHLAAVGGSPALEQSARQLLLARNRSSATSSPPRPVATATAEVIHRPFGHAMHGISDAVVQRLIELFPGSDARRG